MQTHIRLFLTLILITAALPVLAKGKPSQEEHQWDATMSGAVTGTTHSNWTALKGNVWNLVFNKPYRGSYQLSNYFLNAAYDQGNGQNCFAGHSSGSMQLYDDNQDGLMARFWFIGKDSSGNNDVQYVIELFDTEWDTTAGETGPFWSGNFPPSAADGVVTRTAENWAVRPTKRNVKNACEMEYADFGSAADYVQVELECATCQ